MPPAGAEGMMGDDDLGDFGGDEGPVLKVGEEKEVGKQGLKKKLLKEGEGWETPEVGDEVEGIRAHHTSSPHSLESVGCASIFVRVIGSWLIVLQVGSGRGISGGVGFSASHMIFVLPYSLGFSCFMFLMCIRLKVEQGVGYCSQA